MALTRSQQMSRIRGRDTSPERMLTAALVARGLIAGTDLTPLEVRADLVFAVQRVAVFVDGCQWHGCPQHYVRPRTRTAFWSAKLHGNVERDRAQTIALEGAGWQVLRVWEHDVFERLPVTVDRIERVLGGAAERPAPDWRVVAVDVVDAATDLERRHLQHLREAEEFDHVDAPRSTRKWRRAKLGR